MKHFIIVVLFCLTANLIFAQDNFTLSLELVRPTGKIDSSSYFVAKLQNHNDSLSYFVDIFSDAYYHTQKHSFLRIIHEELGSEQIGHEQPFFWFGDKNYIVIRPDSTWKVKLPLFMPLVGIGNGVLPQVEKALQNYQRVQIKLEKFTFVQLYDPKRNILPAKKTIDLYSNWVDVPCEEIIEYLHR